MVVDIVEVVRHMDSKLRCVDAGCAKAKLRCVVVVVVVVAVVCGAASMLQMLVVVATAGG